MGGAMEDRTDEPERGRLGAVSGRRKLASGELRAARRRFVVSNGPHHIAADQEVVFEFLADPGTHGLGEAVKRIDTHVAAVFLAGDNVYKVKRAIKFPFLDFSTLERRRIGCLAEVAVNRRYAPDLYIGVLPVTRSGGSLRLGGDGEIVEWLVHLRRFDETMTLDHVAERGGLTSGPVGKLATRVLATYADAERRDGKAATAALAEVVEETLTELTDAPEVFPEGVAADLARSMRRAFAGVRPQLLRRGAEGWVRRCHGDLHLRNIVLIDGEPTLFDAIEFDESLATTDILYDFAFLLMDLWERGFRPVANLLLNRYLSGTPDIAADLDGLRLLPLFLSLRASVRAKVDALRFLDVERSAAARESAVRYFDAARSFLSPTPRHLIAIGGLSGSGKTTLAREVAPALGRAPGAVHLRSDIERKRFLGAAELARLPASAYTPAITERVFAALREEAEIALRAGHSVVVDAVHRDPTERRKIAEVASTTGASFIGLWLDAPLPTMIARVDARTGDASDATADVVGRQADEPLGRIEWHRLDGSRSPAVLTEEVLRMLA
jgi:aminoglycoside phosphotransferase family enzyme/predicted kinase